MAEGSFHCLCSPTATIYIDFYQYKASALCSVYFCWLCNCVWYSFVDTRPGFRVHERARARALTRFCYFMCSISLLWPGSFNFALSILSFTSSAHHSACRCVYVLKHEQFSSRVVKQQYYMTDGHKLFDKNVCMCVCWHTRRTEPNKINFSGRGDYFPLTSKIWHEETENGYFMRDIEDEDKAKMNNGHGHTHTHTPIRHT